MLAVAVRIKAPTGARTCKNGCNVVEASVFGTGVNTAG